jgi:hypothetical protein
MRPVLYDKRIKGQIFEEIISCISNIECSHYFNSHLEKCQSDQKKVVDEFQSYACSMLLENIQEVEWSVEHKPHEINKDSIDIFGKGHNFVVVIELDKYRADQVAKKFVSRMAILQSEVVLFISLCYAGTERMNKSECKKYFGYCATLACRMGSHYAGFIIE